MSSGEFPGAVAPERHHKIDVGGLGLAIHKWGDEAVQSLFLVHGGFDFARTYEVFAPKLAAAGWRVPDVAEHERTRMVAGEISGWLDHRRRAAELTRHPGTLEELARRRGRMNPRLSLEWLCHLVTVGARHDPDGCRWKIDPSMRFGGFGPWRPEWTVTRLRGLGMPFLGLLASELEEMGFGTVPRNLAHHSPASGRVEVIEGAGHFVHIEPDLVAAMVLDFLGFA